VLQAVNTYDQHDGVIRGDRAERNSLKTITGEFGKLDRCTWHALQPLLAELPDPIWPACRPPGRWAGLRTLPVVFGAGPAAKRNQLCSAPRELSRRQPAVTWGP